MGEPGFGGKMNRQKNKKPLVLSIVVPVYNEVGNISELIDRLEKAAKKARVTFEIILVDDGSLDETWPAIEKAGKKKPYFKGLRLSRNFGTQHALIAGYSVAKGKAIVSLDGDLQHPPELIPEMVEKWKQGFKIVKTRREYAAGEGHFKRGTSKLFYKFFSFLTDVPLDEGSSDFRLIDWRVCAEILAFKDTDLFLRGAIEWVGFKTTTLPFEAGERFSGSSKYTFSRLLKLAYGAIVSFSVVPLKIGIWIGFVTSFLSFGELAFVLYAYAQGWSVPGWASTVGIISLLFGIMFVILGIMGTYIARIHKALQNRPHFIISEINENDRRDR